jgi:predicted transposase
MKTTLTAKLKLLTTPDQFRALRATMLAYRDGLNHVSAYAFAHRKTSSVKRLQQATYADLRTQFGLPSQMACNIPRQVGATYKGLWTKWYKNVEARRLGRTKRRYKGLDKAPHYVSPTLSYNLGRDYLAQHRTGGESADAGGAHPRALPRLDSPCGAAPGGDQSGRGQTLV